MKVGYTICYMYLGGIIIIEANYVGWVHIKLYKTTNFYF